MAIEFGLFILGAYLFGSVPVSYLAAKLYRGIDLRQYGSGNVGTSNLVKLTPKWISIPVIIFDLSKGIIMVWAAWFVGLSVAQQVVVALMVVIGHNWPVFLRFNGGRGALSSIGIIFVLPLINNLVPWGLIVFLAIAAVSLLATHSTAVGVNTGIAALPLVSWGVHEPLPITWGFLGLFLIGVIRRLSVPRSSMAESVGLVQLIVNRLLFDRDIRDREAWMRRRPSHQQK